MKKNIHLPACDIPVLAETDVLVCGGGPAGCAAALGAARNGAKTLLVERDGYLGGATVSQLVSVILSSNGVDFQGVWHEYARALKARNGLLGPFEKKNEWWGSVDPEQVKFVWDALLEEAGVRLLHHAWVSETIVEPSENSSDTLPRITGVILETRAGRRAVIAQRVIDATGDGAVCAQAGVPWDQGDGTHPWAMACTMVFRMANVRWPADHPNPKAVREFETMLAQAVEDGEYDSPVVTEIKRLVNYLRHKCWLLPEKRTGEYLSVMSRVLRVDPMDPFDFTRAVREGREQARQCAEACQRFAPGFENAYLLDTGAHIGLRSSRRIRGVAAVTAEDVLKLKQYPDGIARGSFAVDVWPADSYNRPAGCAGSGDAFRKYGVTRKERNERISAGECYDIRYGALVASGVDNLLMAGRCISAEHHAQSSLRIQQTCMATGQAAGTAAALSLREKVTPRELNTETLTRQLARDRDVEPLEV